MSSVRWRVDQLDGAVGNPDASLHAAGRGNDVAGPHGRDDRAGYSDSEPRPHAGRVGALIGRSSACNNDCHDHSGCKSIPRGGSPHRCSVFREYPLAVRANGVSARCIHVMTYFACNVVPGCLCCSGFGARHRNWLGGWDRCRACVSTGRLPFYPIGKQSAALRLPDNDCSAIHPPKALRAANLKTSMFMLGIQNPQRLTTRFAVASIRRRQIPTDNDRR